MRGIVFGAACGMWAGIVSAAEPPPGTGVAIGAIGKTRLPAPTQYVLRSTVYEQLRSRGVPTQDVGDAPYVYLALVGIDQLDGGCRYRINARLLPNESGAPATDAVATPAPRVPLWTREFTSPPTDCDNVTGAMTRKLDQFAAEFAQDSAAGKLRAAAAARAADRSR